jgi:hypothetical protein
MTNVSQVKNKIIQPMLNMLPNQYNTASAANLLAYTFMAESNGGEYIVQIGGGPALGPFQMEPATHDDCWINFIDYQKPPLAAIGRQLACGGVPSAGQMTGNWLYAAFMARIKYIRSPLEMPLSTDATAIVSYWKAIYNTSGGAGQIDQSHINMAQQAIGA